jgi:hypothetical protein
MVVMTPWYVECLECGAVCTGGCSADWLAEHAEHERPEAPQPA